MSELLQLGAIPAPVLIAVGAVTRLTHALGVSSTVSVLTIYCLYFASIHKVAVLAHALSVVLGVHVHAVRNQLAFAQRLLHGASLNNLLRSLGERFKLSLSCILFLSLAVIVKATRPELSREVEVLGVIALATECELIYRTCCRHIVACRRGPRHLQ